MNRPPCVIFYLSHDPVPANVIEAMAPAVLVPVEAGSASMVVTFRNGNATVIVDSAQIDEVRLTCPRGDSNDLILRSALILGNPITKGRPVLLWRSV